MSDVATPGGRPRGDARRELTLSVLGCLVGALLVLVSAGRSWASVRLGASALLPARTIGVPGRELASGVTALALVGLAGVVAVAATRRWGRLAVGLLLLLDGLGVLLLVLDRVRSLSALALASNRVPRVASGLVSATGWPYVTLLGGVLLMAAGALIALRGPGWSSLGRRYEPPEAAVAAGSIAPVASEQAGPVAERQLWEALDRGEDPTAR